MEEENEDAGVMPIRCPKCGQKFSVGHELTGRIVECGSCEGRFRVNEDVIVRTKKHYPGERTRKDLEIFHRVPMAAQVPDGLQTVVYQEDADLALMEPPSPLRVMAGAAGVLIFLLVILLIVFGSERGGVLDGVGIRKRLILVGFGGLVLLSLLGYGFRAYRKRALAAGVAAVAAAVAVTIFLGGGAVDRPRLAGEGSEVADPMQGIDFAPIEPSTPDAGGDPVAEIRQRVGTEPLEGEQARLEAAGSELNAFGVWLIDLQGRNRILVRDYLLRASKADPSSPIYPREGNHYLMVLSGFKGELEDMALIASQLGNVRAVHHEIGLIEVEVDPEVFYPADPDRMSDPTSATFYSMNLRELRSIDLKRAKQACERLAKAPPTAFRDDISRTLMDLFRDGEMDFPKELSEAILVWCEDLDEAGELAGQRIRHLLTTGEEIPKSYVELVLAGSQADRVPLIMEIWANAPGKWENAVTSLGLAAEEAVIEALRAGLPNQKRSAMRLLGFIGGTKSLELVRAMELEATGEMAILVNDAIRRIEQRLAEQE